MATLRRQRVTLLAGVCAGLACGSLATGWYLTGFDEVSEQRRAYRYMRAQSRYWDEPAPDGGPTWPNWRASSDLAITDATPPMSEAELRSDFAQWELLERCASNGVAQPPEGRGEQRPRSLSPEAAALFIRGERRGLLPVANLAQTTDAGLAAGYGPTADGRGRRWFIDCSRSSVRCVTNFDGGSPVWIGCPAGEVCGGKGADQMLLGE